MQDIVSSNYEKDESDQNDDKDDEIKSKDQDENNSYLKGGPTGPVGRSGDMGIVGATCCTLFDQGIRIEMEAYLMGHIVGSLPLFLEKGHPIKLANVYSDRLEYIGEVMHSSYSREQKGISFDNHYLHFEGDYRNNNVKKILKDFKTPKGFESLKTDELKWSFIRGLFESCELKIEMKEKEDKVFMSVYHSNKHRLENIESFIRQNHNFKILKNAACIEFTGVNALDVLSKMYDGARFFSLPIKKLYVEISSIFHFAPSSSSQKNISFVNIAKSLENAIIPSKKNASDIGYDLSIVKEEKKISKKITLYDTGIVVQPQYGWYAEVMARSSFGKSGYMISNGIGIIDPSYTGSIKIMLTKIDKTLPDLILPCTIAQLVFRPATHFEIKHIHIDEINKTERGSGGFGSTNKIIDTDNNNNVNDKIK